MSLTSPLARVLGAAAGGGALWTAFPDLGWWWAAPVGVALIAVSVAGATLRWAFLAGLVAGLAFFVPSLAWSGIYVGTLPWLALATLEALYWALMALPLAYAGPAPGRGAAGYAVVPLAWVAQEAARSTTPWGGFPWVRLAFSQADSPLLPLAALGGAPLVTAAVATLGAALVALGASVGTGRLRSAAVSAVLLAGLPGLATLVPTPVDGPPVRVALVQGNVPRPGLDFNAERRKVLDNHVVGTEALAGEAGRLAVVVWPENSSDIDPVRNADAAAQVTRAVDAVDAPLLVGAMLTEPAGRHTNAYLLYRPGQPGPSARYVKNHPVPFAEYVPYKDFFRHFSRYVDATADLVPGTELAAFPLQAPDGTQFSALPSICFEVAYDGLIRDIATQPGAGRSVLVVGTNNATFGYTPESEQQFAISRLRAVEHARTVLHVSTVGVSGIIHPDGTVEGKTRLFTAAQVVGEVPVRDSVTIADRLGGAPTWIALFALVALLVARRRTHLVKVDPSRATLPEGPRP